MIAVVDTLGTALALSVTAVVSSLQAAQTVFAAVGTSAAAPRPGRDRAATPNPLVLGWSPAAVPQTPGAVMQTVCGFFLVPNIIPPWVIWVYYISYLKYALEGLFWNQFVLDVVPSVGCLLTQYFFVDPRLNRWTNVIVLMFYPPLIHLLAMAALRWGLRRRVTITPA